MTLFWEQPAFVAKVMKLGEIAYEFGDDAQIEKQAPTPPTDFGALASLDPAELRAAGLAPWNDPNDEDDVDDGVLFPGGKKLDKTLWLFPREWYDFVPDGMPVVDIFGRDEKFIHGASDDDHRFGFLAFGILAPPCREVR